MIRRFKIRRFKIRRFMNCLENRPIKGCYFEEINMNFKKGWEGDWKTFFRGENEQRL